MAYNDSLDVLQPDVFELTNYVRPNSIQERRKMGFIFEQKTDIPSENSARYMEIFSKEGCEDRFVFSGDRVYKLID